jgi:hypothetical protein
MYVHMPSLYICSDRRDALKIKYAYMEIEIFQNRDTRYPRDIRDSGATPSIHRSECPLYQGISWSRSEVRRGKEQWHPKFQREVDQLWTKIQDPTLIQWTFASMDTWSRPGISYISWISTSR